MKIKITKYFIRNQINKIIGNNLLNIRRLIRCGRITEKINSGLLINYDPNTDIGQSLFYFGGFEQRELEVCANFIQSKSVVLDIGSNIGLHSLFFAKIAHEGLVLAFEPSKEAFPALSVNTRSYSNIIPINLGAWNKYGIFDFYAMADDAYSGLKNTKRKSVKNIYKVITIPLDDLVLNLNLERVDFVKIDVEGMEYEVILGMTKIISKFHPVIFCEIYSGIASNEHPELVINFLKENGYQVFVVKNGKLVEFIKHNDDYYNYFFIPETYAKKMHYLLG